ncbi:hypothetical protein NP233_g3235 [Leucocoprinus birnbaumii]|uniref:Exosome complex protein n=1 Tax=Leucocoprinus birnbaumii TaxID=56174 RepID=A0AAD5W3E0_9AGAR|nr:hypothetical protein NP233_g3235 [Leucocoprinus birnbaumii]
MVSETNKIKGKLTNLDASLSDLESLLEPLVSQSLPETILGLELIQQAKLQTLLPYLIYDLIFVYLKAKGVDPKTHGVISELDRVRQYFEKINKAENPPTSKWHLCLDIEILLTWTLEGRTEVDKEAAGRFIKNAISGFVSKPNAPTMEDDSSGSTSIPVKVTAKMIARAQYARALEQERREPNDEDEELQIYDEDDSSSSSAMEDGKPDAVHVEAETPVPSASSKRRRPAIDPFAGYGEATNTPAPSQTLKKAKIDTPDSESVTSSLILQTRGQKKQKKGKKTQ